MAVDAGFDASDLDDLNADMLKTVNDVYPAEAKRFLREQGNRGKKVLRQYIKARTVKRTGNLIRSVDKSAPRLVSEDWQVRVYARAPHSWLIEHGHRLVAWGNTTDTVVEGRHFGAAATLDLKESYSSEVNKFVDELLDKGLSL